MPMAAAIPAIISLAGSLIGGASQRKAAQNYNNTPQRSSSTSTTTAELSPRQQRLNRQIGNYLLEAILQGPTVSQGDRNAIRTQINDITDSQGKRMESNLTARGFGNSGKLGGGFKNLELQRAKSFQTAETDLMRDAQNRFMQLLGLGMNYNTPRTQTTTSNSESTGPQMPVPGWGSILGGAMQQGGSALWLNNLFNQQGGAGGVGGSSPYSITPGPRYPGQGGDLYS
jgi:hypothetical protein